MAEKSFHHQLAVFVFFISAAFALLVLRVFDLQWLHGSEYFNLSEENRLFRWEIPAERGVIFDRYGVSLVKNVRQYYRVAPDQLYSQREYISSDEALPLMVEHPEEVGYELERDYQLPQALAHSLGYVGAVETTDLENDATLGLTDTIGKAGLEQRFDSVLRGDAGHQEFEIDALGNRQQRSREIAPKPGRDLQTTQTNNRFENHQHNPA